MPFSGGQIVFPLAKRVANSGAQARSWLALSLIQGRPLLTSSIFTESGAINDANEDDVSTEVALDGNGMTSIGSVTLNSNRWEDAFWRLTRSGSGFYYLTMDDPRHAMGCYIESKNSLYYFEPHDGLSWFSDPGAFSAGAAAWYTETTGGIFARGLAIHLVAPSYIPHTGFMHPQTSADVPGRSSSAA